MFCLKYRIHFSSQMYERGILRINDGMNLMVQTKDLYCMNMSVSTNTCLGFFMYNLKVFFTKIRTYTYSMLISDVWFP